MQLIDELMWRGLVSEQTEGLRETLARERVTAYIGFDPTAASLHVGSLLTMLNLARLQRAGHSPIGLVGGGTGLIGDPSGKSQERNLLTFEQVEANAQGIRRQLELVLDFEVPSNPAKLVNNVEWLRPIGFLDFLRDVGKHFTVNYMLAKESVKRRVGGEEGISFTEFSYQLLQAYDYLVLHDRLGCTLQMGGSDQWGNITAGCELIRRVRGARVHGLVWPLMTTSSGAKFGKTEAGTIWLDPALTSPYRFYQFWLNTDDRDVIKHLKFFTWLDRESIARLEQSVAADPSSRLAQKTLAEEITRSVHGDAALTKVQADANLRFGGAITAESLQSVDAVASITRDQLSQGLTNTDLVVIAGLAKSKSEAFRLIEQGGVSINDTVVSEPRGVVSETTALGGRFKVSKGRRSVAIVKIE
jgi:tyrosyl-tRNA synthetase